jgi:hypothetical protein
MILITSLLGVYVSRIALRFVNFILEQKGYLNTSGHGSTEGFYPFWFMIFNRSRFLISIPLPFSSMIFSSLNSDSILTTLSTDIPDNSARSFLLIYENISVPLNSSRFKYSSVFASFPFNCLRPRFRHLVSIML